MLPRRQYPDIPWSPGSSVLQSRSPPVSSYIRSTPELPQTDYCRQILLSSAPQKKEQTTNSKDMPKGSSSWTKSCIHADYQRYYLQLWSPHHPSTMLHTFYDMRPYPDRNQKTKHTSYQSHERTPDHPQIGEYMPHFQKRDSHRLQGYAVFEDLPRKKNFGYISNQYLCFIHLFFVGCCAGGSSVGILNSLFETRTILEDYKELCLNICEYFMDWAILISSITSLIFDNTFLKDK